LILFLIGMLIGAVSLGGILMVPAIVLLAKIDIHVVVASAIFSALFTGMLGTYIYVRRGAVNWRLCLFLSLGAAFGAYAGSALLVRLSGTVIEIIVGIAVLVTGIHSLMGKHDSASERSGLGKIATIVVGLITGFGSAISGAAGPLILVPMLLWLKIPVVTAVALGQTIQIPVAAVATLRNYQSGIVDFELGFLIAICLVVGVAIGARLSAAIPIHAFTKIVAAVLIGTAVLMFGRIVTGGETRFVAGLNPSYK